jgi:membrane protein
MEARKLFSEVGDGFERNDLLTYASAISFQLLTAIVPFLLFGLAVLGLLDLSDVWRADLAPEVKARASKEAFAVIDDTVNQILERREVFWLTAGFILALWQVSGAVRAVMGALDGIYDTRRKRPARERYPLSMALSIGVATCLVAAFWVVRFTPLLFDDLNGLLAVALFLGRWLVAIALTALAVGLLAHFAPGVRRPLPWVSSGTAVVIVAWVGMSIGFAFYLSEIADYESIFSHLATLIVVMAYLYASATVFLGGLQLDAIVRSEMNRRARVRG